MMELEMLVFVRDQLYGFLYQTSYSFSPVKVAGRHIVTINFPPDRVILFYWRVKMKRLCHF